MIFESIKERIHLHVGNESSLQQSTEGKRNETIINT